MRETTKKQINWMIVGLISLFILGYSLYEARNLLEGPELTIINPEKTHFSSTNSVLDISGNAQNILSLTVNSRPILITPQGDFADKLLLLSGYNRIAVIATDKFGRENTKIIEAVLIN